MCHCVKFWWKLFQFHLPYCVVWGQVSLPRVLPVGRVRVVWWRGRTGRGNHHRNRQSLRVRTNTLNYYLTWEIKIETKSKSSSFQFRYLQSVIVAKRWRFLRFFQTTNRLKFVSVYGFILFYLMQGTFNTDNFACWDTLIFRVVWICAQCEKQKRHILTGIPALFICIVTCYLRAA